MKKLMIIPAVLILAGCNGDWKSFNNRDGLLAEPSGTFEELTDIKVKNLCTDLNSSSKAFDPALKTGQQYVRTTFISSGKSQIFMKLTTNIKEATGEKVSATTQISNVQGFDIGEMKLEESCEAKNEIVTCTRTGDEGAPKPVIEFEECYLNPADDGKTETAQGAYTLKNGVDIPAYREKIVSKGNVFCNSGGEERSMGKGSIISERYSSPEIIALPVAKSDCTAATFFYAKRVILENGKNIEYIRNETIEVPIRSQPEKDAEKK